MTTDAGRGRTTQPTLVLLAGAALTFMTLLAGRPQLSGGPASWAGDQLALACMWWGAVVSSAWLGATTLACITALARGNTRAAHRVAGWAPPLARRALQRAALMSTWALVPAAAYGAPPTAPITVHVGAGGRLVTGSAGSGRTVSEAPVVRTPETTLSSASTSTTVPRPPTVPPPVRPPTAVNQIGSLPSRGRAYVVQSGDNLWRIARAEVIRTSGDARPNDTRIAPYWRRLISANQATLRSGDPSLIFPGEIVTLPVP
jgi:hypothetical protein